VRNWAAAGTLSTSQEVGKNRTKVQVPRHISSREGISDIDKWARIPFIEPEQWYGGLTDETERQQRSGGCDGSLNYAAVDSDATI
jgi:hypothetical protein